MQVHRHESVQIPHHHARRNRQGTAQGNPDMRQVAAHAFAPFVDGGRRHLIDIGRRIEAHLAPDPVTDRRHLVIPGGIPCDDLAGHLEKPVRFTITARQQEREHAIGQRLHFIEWRAGRHIDRVGRRHIGRGMDGKFTRRRDQALAQIAIGVGIFQHRHARREHVRFARHPLLRTAARTQHQDEWRGTVDDKTELATSTQPHRVLAFHREVSAPS